MQQTVEISTEEQPSSEVDHPGWAPLSIGRFCHLGGPGGGRLLPIHQLSFTGCTLGDSFITAMSSNLAETDKNEIAG